MSAQRPPAKPRSGLPTHHLRAPIVKQFLKFGLVGVSNTLLTLVIYTVLLHFGVWYLAASAIGFAVGALNGYLLNRNWTFRGHGGDHRSTATRWVIVQGCGLLANEALVYLFVEHVGISKLVAQIPTTAIVVVGTFLVNRRWTFNVRSEPAQADAPTTSQVAEPTRRPPAGVR